MTLMYRGLGKGGGWMLLLPVYVQDRGPRCRNMAGISGQRFEEQAGSNLRAQSMYQLPTPQGSILKS